MNSSLCAILRRTVTIAKAAILTVTLASCGTEHATFTSSEPGKKSVAKAKIANTQDQTVKSSPTQTPGQPTVIESAYPDAQQPTETPAPSETASPSVTVEPTITTQSTPTPTPIVVPTDIPAPTPTATPSASTAPTTNPSQSPSPTPTSTAAPDCTTPPKTVVSLMSNTFTNNALRQYLQYKLSQTDCHGTPIPINVDEIRFDVNAHVVTGQASVPFSAYLVSNPSQPLASGTLQTVTGMDMFGVTGPFRWYYSTSNQISIPASTYEIYLSLDYSCTIIHPIGATGKSPAIESIDSYLAFGDATPVTQALQVSNSQLSGACR